MQARGRRALAALEGSTRSGVDPFASEFDWWESTAEEDDGTAANEAHTVLLQNAVASTLSIEVRAAGMSLSHVHLAAVRVRLGTPSGETRDTDVPLLLHFLRIWTAPGPLPAPPPTPAARGTPCAGNAAGDGRHRR